MKTPWAGIRGGLFVAAMLATVLIGAAASLLVMTSTTFAQGFCSNLDEVVKLAPSRFRSIREDAGKDALTTAVTRSLPGTSMCWYDDMAGEYWCAWDVPSNEVQNRVKQLASTIGECYQVQPDYDASLSFAFIDVPSSASVYVNGVGVSVFISIGGRSTTGGTVGSPR
jgi:hypothetical protein